MSLADSTFSQMLQMREGAFHILSASGVDIGRMLSTSKRGDACEFTIKVDGKDAWRQWVEWEGKIMRVRNEWVGTYAKEPTP